MGKIKISKLVALLAGALISISTVVAPAGAFEYLGETDTSDGCPIGEHPELITVYEGIEVVNGQIIHVTKTIVMCMPIRKK